VLRMTKKAKKKEPIYEKLAPGEILIISRDEDGCLEVAENTGGRIRLIKVQPADKEK